MFRVLMLAITNGAFQDLRSSSKTGLLPGGCLGPSKPGEGPSKEERESGLYDLLFVGIAADGRQARIAVRGDRDPGYGSTSKMISECAICLREAPEVKGGMWTPGAAMGTRLIKRLVDHAGITFTVEK